MLPLFDVTDELQLIRIAFAVDDNELAEHAVHRIPFSPPERPA